MSFKKWINNCLLNLFLVATLGLILRYKIAFSFPLLDQRNLLHAHSHFAFAGWISQALMVLMIAALADQKPHLNFKKYQWVLSANLFTAYGMLVSFVVQGYGLLSIILSTLSIFTSYAFCILYWKDLNSLKEKWISHYWFKASLLFNAISSVGAFALAYIMATKNTHQQLYLAAIYFFLHFQYNGWFLFGCLGLATGRFFNGVSNKSLKTTFRIFAVACIPTYLLSTLWLQLPLWLYVIVVMATLAQLIAWVLMARQVKDQIKIGHNGFSGADKILIILSSIALTIKLLLQLGSTIPSLSTLAFGFRPIVIGYLHLILLGVISISLIAFMISNKFIVLTKTAIVGLAIFISGIIINEILLMIQGVAAINYMPVSYINEMLLTAAGIMLSGIVILNLNKKGFAK